MAVTKYSYTKAVNLARFKSEYAASAIVTALDHLELNGTAFDVYTKEALSDPGDKQLLDTLVTDHVNEALPDVGEQRDSDGALMTRPKITKSGRTYHSRCIEFVTSEKGSNHSLDWDGNEVAGEIVLRFYDKDGTDISDQDQSVLDDECVMTEVDATFAFTYDIFRGRMYILDETSEDCRIWCRMVPSVPANLGGSKDMIQAYNVKYLQRKTPIMIDGAAPKEVISGSFPGAHFTKRIRHKPGVRVSFQIEWQLFK